MTIAIGLVNNKGVVLAADSQETVSGYIKTQKGKLTTTIFSNGLCFSIAGAGTSDYISTTKDQALKGMYELKTFDIQDKLEENLLNFFDKHLSRWAGYFESDRPTVELLVSASRPDGGCDLFHYSGTAFHRINISKAIGAGILLANSLLEGFMPPEMSIDQMASSAIFILSKVKKQVDTCGGFTTLVAMRPGGDFSYTSSDEISEIRGKTVRDGTRSKQRPQSARYAHGLSR